MAKQEYSAVVAFSLIILILDCMGDTDKGDEYSDLLYQHDLDIAEEVYFSRRYQDALVYHV